LSKGGRTGYGLEGMIRMCQGKIGEKVPAFKAEGGGNLKRDKCPLNDLQPIRRKDDGRIERTNGEKKSRSAVAASGQNRDLRKHT